MTYHPDWLVKPKEDEKSESPEIGEEVIVDETDTAIIEELLKDGEY